MQGPRDANASPPYAGTVLRAHRVCGLCRSRLRRVGKLGSRDVGPSVSCTVTDTQMRNDTVHASQKKARLTGASWGSDNGLERKRKREHNRSDNLKSTRYSNMSSTIEMR
jgi:hypothetical protein